MCLKLLFAPNADDFSLLSYGAWTVPQEAAGRFDVILQLEGGTPADGHAVVVLNLHRVLDVVGLGHCASIIDLERETCGYSKKKDDPVLTRSPPYSHHGSAAGISVRIRQVPSIRHRKLIWFDVSPQHLLPVTCRPEYQQKLMDHTERS